jgi:hypothetical protein
MLGHLKSHEGVFNPEEVAILTAVFDETWKAVQNSGAASALNGEAQATRETIARRIIAMALLGERDPGRLRAEALQCLARKHGSAAGTNAG